MKGKRIRQIVILCAVTVVLMAAGLMLGSVRLSMKEIIGALTGASGPAAVIVKTLRLPRVLGAALSGAALSASGLLLQTVTDNDLASPNLVGVNAGAGIFVMLILCFLPGVTALIPAAAFIGALISAFLVIGISSASSMHRSRSALVLAGAAVSALWNAGIAFLSQCFPDVLTSYIWFSTGGFNGVYLSDLALPAVLIFAGLLCAFLLTSKLNLLVLGDDVAASLGVNVRLLRILSVILASLLSAASVTYAGLLGFVGLMTPHIARKFTGHSMKALFFTTILLGASLTILSDLIGRTVFSPSEVSAGVILALIGAPFFVFLLISGRKKA